MNDFPSVKILGAKINLLTELEIFQKIQKEITSGAECQIITANPEMLVYAQKDEELKKIINSSWLVVPDGVGLVWAIKRKIKKLPERIAGIDLAEALFRIGEKLGWRFYLLGGRPAKGNQAAIIEAAAQNLKNKFPNLKIVGWHHGYFSQDETLKIVKQIASVNPDILLAGLGVSKQEKFIFQNSAALNFKVALGVGGAFDIWSGKLKRAPALFKKLNIEWLFRFYQEPRRFGKIFSLAKFVYLNLAG